MKYRFYITDLFDGQIKGTNSVEDAMAYSNCEEYFILDTEKDMWLSYEKYEKIPEMRSVSDEE